MRSRQLGPEAAETQQRLQAQQREVSKRIEQLEEQMQVLHKLVLTAKRGVQPLKAPTLDTISRSIRHITMAINQRMYEIDDLSLRFDMAQISSPPPQRRRQAPVEQRSSSAITDDVAAPLTRSPLRAALARPAGQEKVASLAARALNEERNLAQARSILQDARPTPIVTTILRQPVPAARRYSDPLALTTAAPATEARSAPVSLLATPRKFVPVEGPRATGPAQSPLTMGSLATPPSKFGGLPSSFGGLAPIEVGQKKAPTSKLAQPPLNFSSFGTPPPPTAFSTLDSGAFDLSSPGEDHDSGSGSRRRGKASSHASAPKFVAPKEAAKAPATASSFSFGPPPPLPKSTFAQPSAFSFGTAPSFTTTACVVSRRLPFPRCRPSLTSAAIPSFGRSKSATPTFAGFAGFGAPAAPRDEAPAVAEHEKAEETEGAEEAEEDEEAEADEDELEAAEDEDDASEEAYDWTGKGSVDGEEDDEEASEEDYEG